MACEISAFKLALDLNISMPHISFPPVEKGNLNEAAWKSCLQAISVGSGPFFPLNQQNEHQSTQAQPPNAAHCGDVMESQQGADSNSGLEESNGSSVLDSVGFDSPTSDSSVASESPTEARARTSSPFGGELEAKGGLLDILSSFHNDVATPPVAEACDETGEGATAHCPIQTQGDSCARCFASTLLCAFPLTPDECR